MGLSMRLRVVSIFMICSLSALAQITEVNNKTSTPVPGSGHNYISEFNETTNPANGQVSVRISVDPPAGRGISMPFSIAYDSNTAHSLTYTLDQGWFVMDGIGDGSPYSQWGWSYTVPSVTYTQGTIVLNCAWNYYANYVFHDSNGVGHNLNLANSVSIYSAQQQDGTSNTQVCYNDDNVQPFLTAGDHSFLATANDRNISQYSTGLGGMESINSLDGTFYNFTPYNPPTNPRSGSVYSELPSSIQDRNGNRIVIGVGSNGGSFTVTDTLGRAAVTASGFGNNGDTISVAGLTQPYTLTWGTISANASINGTLLSQPPPVSYDVCPTLPATMHGVYVVTAITLPNGQQYQFSYDPVYGLLQQITYPTGAFIKYTWQKNTQSDLYIATILPPFQSEWVGGGVNWVQWQPPSFNCYYSHDWYALATRDVSYDGVNIASHQTFSYSTTWNTSAQTWTAKQTIVITQDLITNQSTTTTYNYGALQNGGNDPINPSISAIIPMPIESLITYQATGGPVLRTVAKQWLQTDLLSSEQVTLDNGLTSSSNYSYANRPSSLVQYNVGSLNLMTEKDDYGYGSGSPGALMRKTMATYADYSNVLGYNINGAPMQNFILDRPLSAITYDGSNNRVAEADFAYDQTAVSSVSSLPTGTHNETQYGSGATPARGNATTITHQCFPGCSNVVSTFTFDETGQILTATDPKGNTTQFSYADNFASGTGTPSGNTNAYLTSVTRPVTNGVNHITSFLYGFNDGQLRQSTDENGNSTQYKYNDVFLRLTETDSPDGGQSFLAYTDTPGALSVQKTVKQTAGTNIVSYSYLDGLGHIKQTRQVDPQGDDFVDTTYDGLGRVSTVSNPHRLSSLPTDGITTTQYDALGRVNLVIPQDGTSSTNNVSTSYTGNCTTVKDEVGHARISCSDALGRLTQVTEPNPASGSLTSGAYPTYYYYDALGNLLCVEQHGDQSSSSANCSNPADLTTYGGNWRVRKFSYDSLSRLTASVNPEVGKISYVYDANGNVSSKTDNRGITTTYLYDALNRMYDRTHSDGTQEDIFLYDVSPGWNGFVSTNGIGRLTGSWSVNAPHAQRMFSYDVMGHPLIVYEWMQSTGTGWQWSAYNYNFDGSTASITYPTTGTTIYYGYDTAGRLQCASSVNSCSGTVYKQVDTFAPTGAMWTGREGLVSGSTAISLTDHYNPRLQLDSINAVNGGTTLQSIAYDYAYGTANNGNINVMNNLKNTARSQSYMYDSLNRLTHAWSTTLSGTAPGAWDINYLLDPWGNMTNRVPSTSFSNSPAPDNFINTVNTNNQLVSQVNYDTAGNSIFDGNHHYAFDAENRVYMLDNSGSQNYVYDPEGRRVGKRGTSNDVVYWYGAGSTPLLITNDAGVPTTEYYFFGSERVAQREINGSSSTLRYYLGDNIGSTSLLINADGSIYSEDDYYPYGKEHCISGACSFMEFKYTGKERDSESGLDYFGARYFASSMGRWVSTDPKGISLRHLLNPQKLNKYTYVLNNPLTLVDPNGMEEITIVYRTFIPQKTVSIAGSTYAGDNRGFSTSSNASSRTTITITIETDASKKPGNPIISQTSSAGETKKLDASGSVIKTDTAKTGLPTATGTRDSNGNPVINIQQDVKNPLSPVPQVVTPGITADLTVTVPQNASNAQVTGTASQFPAEELNVTRADGNTTAVYQSKPDADATPLSLFKPDQNVNTQKATPQCTTDEKGKKVCSQ